MISEKDKEPIDEWKRKKERKKESEKIMKKQNNIKLERWCFL